MKYSTVKPGGLLLCLVLAAAGLLAKEPTSLAFEKLLSRIVSTKAAHFKFKYISAQNGKDVFELSNEDGYVMLKGNNNNSLAVALNHYLKYTCFTTVSWYANDPIQLPAILPRVVQNIRQEAKVKERFFLNYCTFGYSFPWWRWKDWERLIDWMALNGINLPLAITGQEAVWYKVWIKLGLSDQDIRSYFTGPAHLPWHRMSNIDRWQGPLPLSYISQQLELQKLILRRERELGMKPILPAFSGHVPALLARNYPGAKITKLGEWSGFPEKYWSQFLDPFDPLFRKIQQLFLEEQTRQFGTDHIYGTDPFNEVTPPSWEPRYLSDVSKIIYESIRNADSSGKWLMMTWIFYFQREHWTNERIKSFVRAVPQDKLILLDYYGEDTEVWKLTNSFYDQPFIWCYLGNFGGNTMLTGNLSEVSKRISYAIGSSDRKLTGIGSTLEGLNPNTIMYDYIFERAWNPDSTSLSAWVNKWAYSRVGRKDAAVAKYWNLLVDSIYIVPAKLGQGTLTGSRPTLTGFGNWTTNPAINYSNALLFKIWQGLAAAQSSNVTYHNDLVNIGRQVLGNYFAELRDSFSLAYQKKDSKQLHGYGKQMLELMDDLDALLAADKNLSLHEWISNAEKFGKDKAERKYYSENAKVILTTWSGKNHMLNDYANRSWSGLVSGFYKKRWEMFIREVTTAVEKGEAFNEKMFLEKVTSFEWKWATGNATLQRPVVKKAAPLCKRLIYKYEGKVVYGRTTEHSETTDTKEIITNRPI